MSLHPISNTEFWRKAFLLEISLQYPSDKIKALALANLGGLGAVW
jgi:hypothetical protein